MLDNHSFNILSNNNYKINNQFHKLNRHLISLILKVNNNQKPINLN